MTAGAGAARPVDGLSGTIVCDASVLVALLLDDGPAGRWAADTLSGRRLAAPALVYFETANIIRRHEAARIVTADQATLARADLLALTIEEWPYRVLTGRVTELRRNLTAYDAAYVALAELLDGDLATLDHRIGSAPGIGCSVVSPDL